MTIVVSRTTISCAARMTVRNTDGRARKRLRDPVPVFGEAVGDSGVERLRVDEGIDCDLPTGILMKRKLPPVSIRRVPPDSKRNLRKARKK